jgi:hypothetical protein
MVMVEFGGRYIGDPEKEFTKHIVDDELYLKNIKAYNQAYRNFMYHILVCNIKLTI